MINVIIFLIGFIIGFIACYLFFKKKEEVKCEIIEESKVDYSNNSNIIYPDLIKEVFEKDDTILEDLLK